MQACSHAVADRTHRWSKIPDVRAFDRCSDNKQGQGCVVTAIVAETPVRPEANYPVGAFIRAPSEWPSALRRMSIIANDARPKASGVASREAADSPTRRPSWMFLSFLSASLRCGTRTAGITSSISANPRLACRAAGREARPVARVHLRGQAIARTGGLPLSRPPTSRLPISAGRCPAYSVIKTSAVYRRSHIFVHIGCALSAPRRDNPPSTKRPSRTQGIGRCR